ncbi:hybrid sensor histidine kinase/response regulator [Phenylobacterium montanum]|uniref:histidine kinase n=1 Tax=Phenylobacterium montanum TaxID=2823693 RepID=A0A975IU31_9CAUL|nr:ATP-binding protein [Caulobacter sp. S6]QUD87378.1 response regulator [Caulobacter sp. S6]
MRKKTVERLTRTVINHVPAMIAYWDSELKCRFANEKYLEWFGRSADEMIGISIQDLMGQELFAKNEPFIRGALAGQRQGFERTLYKTSGEVGHTWAQYIPDIDRRGRVLGFYAMVTDVSPLKEAEERLKEANIALNQARDEAEAAAAAKSMFLSNISHELRNPLTAIIGFADLLAKQGGLSDMQTKYVSRIQQASSALLTTVNDVLDFSKLEAGQVEIEPRPIDPAALGLRALEMFELDMAKKGLAHRFEAVGAPARVLADDTRVRQILMNLIGNAVKFTARGGVQVRCEFRNQDQRLRYEIIDTGPGIPRDRQDRLFKRFSQVDASTNRSFGGTGLGLAICKGLAEAMHGKVGVMSAPGEGSCFWVEIPAPVALEPIEFGDAKEAVPQPDVIRGLRLLVVDDELANRELVRSIVEPLGVVVTEAAGGPEAVSLARADGFDIILMDVRMPEIDGPMATKIIRAMPGPNASTPIIGFTADIVGDAPADWARLFDGLVLKPVVPADLVRALADYGVHRGRPDRKTERAVTPR